VGNRRTAADESGRVAREVVVMLRNALLGLMVSIVSSPAGAQLAVTNVDLLKSILRVDGVEAQGSPNVLICVTGTNLVSATVAGPADVTPRVLTPTAPFPDDFCLFVGGYASVAALEAEFPAGDYVFDLAGESLTDAITVDFSATEPGALLEVDTPASGATDVSPDEDLLVGWTTVEKSTPCLPAACSDNIGAFVVRLDTEEEVAGANDLPSDALDVVVPAAALSPSTAYELELETYNGVFDEPGTTDKGVAVSVTRVWEDISVTAFATPEPGAGTLGVASLLTLLGLRRYARGHRLRSRA